MMRTAILAVVVAGVCVASAVEATPLLTMTGPTGLTVGVPTDFTIGISGLVDGAAPSLGAFDIDVLFNPALLQFSGATFGDAILGDQLDLFGLGSLQAAGPVSAGRQNLFELSFDAVGDLNSLQPGSFGLATIAFIQIGAGTSTITLVVNALSDADGNRIQTGATLPSITVSAVPEPGTLSLVALGGLLSGSVRRRWRIGGVSEVRSNTD